MLGLSTRLGRNGPSRSGRVGDAARGVHVDEGARVGVAAGEVGGHEHDVALRGLAVPMAAGAVSNELELVDLRLHGGNSLVCH